MYKQGRGGKIKPQIKPRECGAAMSRLTGLLRQSVCISPYLSASCFPRSQLCLFICFLGLITPISFSCNPATMEQHSGPDAPKIDIDN